MLVTTERGMIMKDRIYYVMDPMCGWCYGFSEVIQKLYKNYKEKYDFELVPGGMWTEGSIKVLDQELGQYIKSHNSRIEAMTGAKFGKGFNQLLDSKEEHILDSFPGSHAVTIVNEMDKDKSFAYMAEVQKSFFQEGLDVRNPELYFQIAQNLGLDIEQFKAHWQESQMVEKTKSQFSKARKLSSTGYPSLILEKNKQLKQIAAGYTAYSNIANLL